MTSRAPSSRPELVSLDVPGAPEAWRDAGFAVGDAGATAVGGVALRLGAPRFGWALRGLAPGADLDGLPLAEPLEHPAVEHPNGATAVDHVVAFTPDFDRTTARLTAAGLDHRRTREAGGGVRQGFFVLGPCLLELAGPVEGEIRFWGITLIAPDLDATAAVLGDRLGPPKDAVQAGRRIATARREAGLGVPLAFMSPRG